MPPRPGHRKDPFADVQRLLEPRSIAVIGASDAPGSLGGTVVRFLQRFGYPGPIWPVNPRRDRVAGLPCYPAPQALPEPADLALLAVPAAAVVEVVRACAAAGIGHGIVWAGGFAEIGGEGRARQDALVELCRRPALRLCGPNCIGIINVHLPMVASFASALLATDRLLPGNISMVSQSGGMATVAQALAQEAGFGFRHVISSGNEAVLTTADFVHALVRDAETKVIAAYVEGVRDPEKLLLALAGGARGKKARGHAQGRQHRRERACGARAYRCARRRGAGVGRGVARACGDPRALAGRASGCGTGAERGGSREAPGRQRRRHDHLRRRQRRARGRPVRAARAPQPAARARHPRPAAAAGAADRLGHQPDRPHARGLQPAEHGWSGCRRRWT